MFWEDWTISLKRNCSVGYGFRFLPISDGLPKLPHGKALRRSPSTAFVAKWRTSITPEKRQTTVYAWNASRSGYTNLYISVHLEPEMYFYTFLFLKKYEFSKIWNVPQIFIIFPGCNGYKNTYLSAISA